MDRVFKSKVGIWYHFVVLLFCLLCIKVFVTGESVWAMIILLLITLLFIHVLLDTWYKVTADGRLVVHCSIFPEKQIPVAEITAVEQSSLPVSSYALSLDRIIIWKGNAQWMMISPTRKQEFVNLLRKINPDIEIKK